MGPRMKEDGLVDLHMHTTFSDGVMAPDNLVRHASTLGLSAIAITDHDNVEAYQVARPVAMECGIGLVPGVELSTQLDHQYPDLHLVGLFIDSDHQPLRASLERAAEYRSERAQIILDNVNERLRCLGCDEPLTLSDLPDTLGTVGRPHIAAALVQRGYATDRADAFNRFLADVSVPNAYLDAEEAARLVRNADGICILAHPLEYLRYTFKDLPKDAREIRRQLERLLAACYEIGVQGVEVFHPRNREGETQLVRECAEGHNLEAISGGSDFHGEAPWDRLYPQIEEDMIPYSVLRNIQQFRQDVGTNMKYPMQKRITVRCEARKFDHLSRRLRELMEAEATKCNISQEEVAKCSFDVEQGMPIDGGTILVAIVINIVSAILWEKVVKPALDEFDCEFPRDDEDED